MRRRLQRVFPLVLLLTLVFIGAAPAQRRSQEERLAALEAKLAEMETAQDNAISRLDQMRLDLDNT